MRKSAIKALSIFVFAVLLLLTGCSQPKAGTDTAQIALTSSSPEVHYSAPQIDEIGFNTEKAQNMGCGLIDLSSASSGVIFVQGDSDKRLKFQIILDDTTYTYDLPNDGTTTAFPVNMGSGNYKLRAMGNISGDKYAELWSQEAEIKLLDEFQPFLRPSQMVDYSPNSVCVQKAKELVVGCSDDLEVAGAVYNFLVENISYDYEKAQNVQSGYLPNPDQTLADKKGICFDYAALAAAMLRSQGIPCQLITGYVSPDDVYHAWNRIYIKNQGWISVEIKASGDNWNRVDITFAASGVNTDELIDDALYTTRFVY